MVGGSCWCWSQCNVMVVGSFVAGRRGWKGGVGVLE